MSTADTTLAAPAPALSTAKYNLAIGYLRAFIVVMVVAHHAALAYHPYAPPPPASLLPQPRWWGAFPVVDPHKWGGSALLVGFNDQFFMSLMFFLSGLFIWRALSTKGVATFLRDRLLRLGLPFAAAAAVLAPLAYYPTYLQISGHAGVAGFWHQWLSLGNWPVGSAWFIAVLLAFDGIAALLFVLAPSQVLKLGAMTSGADRRPAMLFVALIAVSAVAYLPLARHFSPFAWWTFGPFAFQTTRILHYLVYFLTGVAVGSSGLGRGLLSPQGKLARRWPVWLAASLIFFVLATTVINAAMASWGKSPMLASAMNAGFVLSCAASCFAFLAAFLRFAQSRSQAWDSLSANSYGIYLIHYPVVSWMQYVLVPAALPAVAKWLIVFPGALALSWAAAKAMRRIPAVAHVI